MKYAVTQDFSLDPLWRVIWDQSTIRFELLYSQVNILNLFFMHQKRYV